MVSAAADRWTWTGSATSSSTRSSTRGKLTTFADIYKLDRDSLAGLERMGEKAAENVIAGIDASRERPLERLLKGLGVHHMGGSASRALAARFGSIDAITAADTTDIEAIEGLGSVIAESVHFFFGSDAGAAVVESLKAVGLDPTQTPGPARRRPRGADGPTCRWRA